MSNIEHQRTALGGVFTVKCVDADGNVKWDDEFPNLVVNTGLQFLNTQLFKGVTYTATWYMGLVNSGGTYAAGNTMLSHSGWTENVSYVSSARPTMTFNTATTGDPSVIASVAVSFVMNASATLGGSFLTTDNTKSGTAGTLFSVGNYSTGNRSVLSGDTLSISYSFLADAI